MMDSTADFGGEPLLNAFQRKRPPQVRPEHFSKYAVVYVRVSSPDQLKKSIGSIAVQKALVGVARRWGWTVRLIKFIDDDLGVSAKSVYRRTGFAKATHLKKRTRRTRWSGLELTP